MDKLEGEKALGFHAKLPTTLRCLAMLATVPAGLAFHHSSPGSRHMIEKATREDTPGSTVLASAISNSSGHESHPN